MKKVLVGLLIGFVIVGTSSSVFAHSSSHGSAHSSSSHGSSSGSSSSGGSSSGTSSKPAATSSKSSSSSTTVRPTNTRHQTISAMSILPNTLCNYTMATAAMGNYNRHHSNNNSTNPATIEELAKYKEEMEKTDDPAKKKEICETVVSRFASYNIDSIKKAELRTFLADCRSRKYQ